jgi:tRNA U34 5-methylaminomethyl-2-thiouridine-forming methyltransferase MnmC
MLVNESLIKAQELEEQIRLFDQDLSAQDFKEIGFDIELTKDGSPTLRLINGTERGGESMHHTGGALGETCLIYGQAFDYGFKNIPQPTIISLGLGLGYVELLAVVYSMIHNSSSPLIYSYESNSSLRQLFENFYLGTKPNSAYEWILKKMAAKFNLDPEKIRLYVRLALEQKRLKMLGDFTSESAEFNSFDVFCYDAYSKKTSPELWDENEMIKIFNRGSEKSCVSSYASNSVLKRSLAIAGFKTEKLEGFQGKRNRTWAYR